MSKFKIFFLISVLLNSSVSIANSELSGSSVKQENLAPVPVLNNTQCEPLCNDFPPRSPIFLKGVRPQNTYDVTNKEWIALSAVQRATYIFEKYKLILERQKYECDYSPRILTCKSYRESMHFPQWQTPIEGSTAAALAMVTQETMKDMLTRRGFEFNSVIPGFEGNRDYENLWFNQQAHMLLQMDLSIGVLERKRIDYKLNCDNIKPFLKFYYGHPRDECNKDYSNQIYSCAKCIKKNKGVVTYECLTKSKTKVEGC